MSISSAKYIYMYIYIIIIDSNVQEPMAGIPVYAVADLSRVAEASRVQIVKKRVYRINPQSSLGFRGTCFVIVD